MRMTAAAGNKLLVNCQRQQRRLASAASGQVSLSFCGCGFLGVYHLGVAAMLAENGERLLKRVQRYSGASAGALVASVLATRGPDSVLLHKCLAFSYDLSEKVRRQTLGVVTPRTSLIQPIGKFLHHMLPVDAHVTASSRLYVSLTCRRTWTNEIVSSFASKRHLIQCLLASCYLPRVTGTREVLIDGESYADGGLTNNLPQFAQGRTISVSPFSGKHTICPQDDQDGDGRPRLHATVCQQRFRVNAKNATRAWHALAPPGVDTLKCYTENGRLDARMFLQGAGYYNSGDS